MSERHFYAYDPGQAKADRAQALIDGLGDHMRSHTKDGWVTFTQVFIYKHDPRRYGRAVHVHLDGRIRVYDAAGRLEREYGA